MSSQVTQELMDELSSLANSSLLPLVNDYVSAGEWWDKVHEYTYEYWIYPIPTQPDYEFPPANADIRPASNVQGVLTYGIPYDAGPNYPGYGITLGIAVYPYKTIGGRKSYCLKPALGSITSDDSWNSFIIDWSWTASPNADGYYVARIPISLFSSSSYETSSVIVADQNIPYDWTDVGSATTFHDTELAQPFTTRHCPFSWNTTLNRIRADYWTIMNQTGSLLQDSIFSGPHAVAVNDHDVYSMDNAIWSNGFSFQSQQGELPATMNINYGTAAPNPNQTVYQNVSFIYSLNDALNGLTIGCGRRVDFGYAGTNTSITMSYSGSLGGQWNCYVYWPFTWTYGGTPNIGTFTTYATPSTGISWFITGSTISTASYALVALIDLALSALPSSSIGFQVGGYSFDAGPWIISKLVYATNNHSYPIEALHPTSECMMLSAPNMPAGESDFIVNENYSEAFWYISNPNVKGVWVANTFPVPANNVYCDQDLPNYVGQVDGDIYYSNPMAVSSNLVNIVAGSVPWCSSSYNYPVDNPPTDQIDNSDPILASSLRQQAYTLSNDIILTFWISGSTVSECWFSGSYPYSFNFNEFEGQPQYNLIHQSEQVQPSQWMVLQSGSQMPIRWGNWGNPNQHLSVLTITLDSGSGGWWNIAVYGNATDVKVSLRTPHPLNSIAPYNTRIYDGGPLNPAYSMSLYEAANYYPTTTTYDYMTNTNQIVMPSNAFGGMSYFSGSIINGGFSYWIQNNTSASVTFDLIEEIDAGVVPRELAYIPTTYECYSYAVGFDIPPGYTYFYTFASTWPSFLGVLPVPQAGYMIYSIMAHRIPTQKNGIGKTLPSASVIDISFGQYKLKYDGTYAFAPFYSDNSFLGAGDLGTQGAGDTNSSEGAGGEGEPFTIQIPANETDSGQITVAWPVVHGNPLVYKSSEPCIVQAWVNFQPLWFSTNFSMINWYINMDYNYITNFNPTTYQFCNTFENIWDVTQANWPDNYGQDVYGDHSATRVQWPMSNVVYNDLWNCLQLL